MYGGLIPKNRLWSGAASISRTEADSTTTYHIQQNGDACPMKIARALKTIARLQGDLTQKRAVLANSVSTLDENEFGENFKEIWEESCSLSRSIAELRVKVMTANIQHGLFKRIMALGWLKQDIDFLRKLDIKSGFVEAHFGSTKSKYKSQITSQDRDALVKEIQKLIESEIDALDAANSTIDIE